MGKTQTKSDLLALVAELGEKLSAADEKLRDSLAREENQMGSLTRLNEYCARLEKNLETTQTALASARAELVRGNYKLEDTRLSLEEREAIITELKTQLRISQAQSESRAEGIKEGFGAVLDLIHQSF